MISKMWFQNLVLKNTAFLLRSPLKTSFSYKLGG